MSEYARVSQKKHDSEETASPPVRIVHLDTKPVKATEAPGKNNRFLITYSLALFLFAAVFIFISYLYTAKLSEQNFEHAQNSQQVSLNALQTVELMRESISSLNGKLQELEQSNAQMADELARLSKNSQETDMENQTLRERAEQAELQLTQTRDAAKQQQRALELLRLAQLSYEREELETAADYIEQLKPLSLLLPIESVEAGGESPTAVFTRLYNVLH